MKAFRSVRKTMQAPGLERYQQRSPVNAEALGSPGPNLADANSKKD
jgi:hypothetical protein